MFSVKRKLPSGLEKACGFISPAIVNFFRFEFDSAIYCNFCSFWVLFIYCYWFVVVLRLEDYFVFVSPHSWLNRALYSPLKYSFCGKSFLNYLRKRASYGQWDLYPPDLCCPADPPFEIRVYGSYLRSVETSYTVLLLNLSAMICISH